VLSAAAGNRLAADPRAPGAQLPDAEDEEAEAAPRNPFAKLAALRPPKG
jgi:hypothetical protein